MTITPSKQSMHKLQGIVIQQSALSNHLVAQAFNTEQVIYKWQYDPQSLYWVVVTLNSLKLRLINTKNGEIEYDLLCGWIFGGKQ